MLSWVFRHRHRLRLIYGSAPPPALASPSPGLDDEREADRAARERGRQRLEPDSGSIERRGNFLVIGPMPRRTR